MQQKGKRWLIETGECDNFRLHFLRLRKSNNRVFSSPRRDRGRRGGGGGGGGGGSGAKAPVERRVFVSNIPFEMKWQEVKDLFRDEVGEVDYGKLAFGRL